MVCWGMPWDGWMDEWLVVPVVCQIWCLHKSSTILHPVSLSYYNPVSQTSPSTTPHSHHTNKTFIFLLYSFFFFCYLVKLLFMLSSLFMISIEISFSILYLNDNDNKRMLWASDRVESKRDSTEGQTALHAWPFLSFGWQGVVAGCAAQSEIRFSFDENVHVNGNVRWTLNLKHQSFCYSIAAAIWEKVSLFSLWWGVEGRGFPAGHSRSMFMETSLSATNVTNHNNKQLNAANQKYLNM